MRIEACYDSHVHWPATGEFSGRLRLDELKKPEDVSGLKIQPQHSRGEWLIGFGWDDHGWKVRPTRQDLDKVFSDKPVAFTRNDAHTSWVNTEALKRAGHFSRDEKVIPGGRIERDKEGWPTGILVDQARNPVEDIIPQPTPLEMRRNLLRGVKTFNAAGFTHFRDMTCDELQWNEAVKLDESGLLTAAVEEYFWLKEAKDIDRMLNLAASARVHQGTNLRAKGLKIFLDGALGSEGAWLSRCYHGSDQQGVILWEKPALREALIKSWERELEVALHAIGDEAADWLLDLVLELKCDGISGKFHIEHAELVRPETLEKMRGLQIACHLQPVQWLSDQRWLKQKLGDLSEFAFPWRRLQEADIEFDFGSDSPIDPASISQTLRALRESSEAGIPRLLGGATSYMSYRDLSWAPNSYTLLADESPREVVFRGEHLVSNQKP